MDNSSFLLNHFKIDKKEKIRIQDKIKSFEIEFTSSSSNYDFNKIIPEFISKISSHDNCQLIAYSEISDDSLVCNCDESESINDFNSRWEKHFNKFSINISKNVVNNYLCIYSSLQFTEYILNNFESAIREISNLISKNGYLCFNEFEAIKSNKWIPLSKEINNRESIIAAQIEFCHFNNSETIQLIPEDFVFSIQDSEDILSKLFQKILTSISIIYLYDVSSIKNNQFKVTLSGLKKLLDEIDFSKLTIDYDFYNIYKWVYSSGNIDNKIGLARNILSIHFKNSIFEIEDNTLSSLKSNYKLYLKNNTKNYLEMKNQIEQHLWNINRQFDNIKMEFKRSLFTSLAGLLTFFITVILSGALSSNKSIIFTRQVCYISWLFIVIFFIILIIKSFDEKFSIKRILTEYTDILSRYKHLIDEEEFKSYEDKKTQHKFILFSFNRILWFLSMLAIICCLIFSNSNNSLKMNNDTNVSNKNNIPKHFQPDSMKVINLK